MADLVYSSLSFYGRHRAEALPGTWFATALEPLGVAPATTRQTLWRMERDGALESTRHGRVKHYAPTPTTEAILDAGVQRILRPREVAWDGRWTLIQFRFGTDQRAARDRARDVLQSEGFARLGPGLYTHPRDRSDRVLAALDRSGLANHVVAFRGPRVDGGTDQSLADRLWPLEETASAYRDFLEQFEPVAHVRVVEWKPAEAFALRFLVVSRYLRISWADPELPSKLAPGDFPARRARKLTRDLIRRLETRALRHAEAAWDEATGSAGAT